MALDRDVFPTEAWATFERDWVVAILDFPTGGKQPAAPAAAAGKKFDVRGLPTMVALGPDGDELGRVVGGASSAAAYVARLESAINK